MNICGISYLRGYNEAEVIGDVFPQDNVIDNFITLRFNKRIGGDKAEVWRTDLLKQFCYPVFDGEKFFGESYIWVKISERNDMLFRNKIVYITAYLEGGLSKSGRAYEDIMSLWRYDKCRIDDVAQIFINSEDKGSIVVHSLFPVCETKHKTNVKASALYFEIVDVPVGTMIYFKWKKIASTTIGLKQQSKEHYFSIKLYNGSRVCD